jgi:ABC-2 type transport system permease protein
VRRAFKAMPTLLKVGFAEAIAYRAEMLVWVLSTTMPLIMMMLWTSVATVAPVVGKGGANWNSGQFVAYFLSVFVVRQLVSAWAAWEINFEVRQGSLGMRLLRPIHPVVSFAMSNLAYMPMRALVTMPVVLLLVLAYGDQLSHDWRVWALWGLALPLGWAIAFFVNVTVGAMSFYLESSLRLMDVWLALFFVFSGYLFPLEFFPPWLRATTDYLPFRYIIGLPVELMTGSLAFDDAWPLVGRQLIWVGGAVTAAFSLWTRGVQRFQAFGG